MDPFSLIKRTYSTILLIFSVVLLMALIAQGDTKIANDVHPALAYVTGWGAILWLTMVEGGQASMVGLAPINKDLYENSHPLALKSTSLCHKGDNLDRYLLGRQFMVVLVVFTVNMSCAPIADASIWNLPSWLQNIFLGSGLAMILFTTMVGQLNTQINASHCMLDYINNYFAIITLYVAMGIEFSGLLHSSYLVQMLVGKLAGKEIESNEEPRDAMQNLFFWGRALMSLAILVFAFTVTLAALFTGQTTLWESVPSSVAVIVFFILMSVVGMLEGMQIAFFAVSKLTKEERGESIFAKKTCELLFRGEGRNLPGFMIGRQLCIVSCMFFVARVTSVSIAEGDPNLFNVSDGFQEFMNTGMFGALITTIVGSISWQLVASAFPIAFLSNPVTYLLLRLCLLLEATGICSGAWVLAAIHKRIAGFQHDEVYIGTAEERSKNDMGDNTSGVPTAGHPVKLPGFADNAPSSLQKLVKKDASVRDWLNSIGPESAE